MAGEAPLQAVRTVSNRDVERTAAARCRVYSLFSDLTASPHEVDTREAVAARIGMLSDGLPYPLDIDELASEFVHAEPARLQTEYSGLFEVGSHGPPAPIREDLQTGQKAGTREDIVGFMTISATG
jgi:hypothetical protein